MMAVWTPGSYLVREYARHIEEVQATGPDGKALELSKVRKNRWKVKTGGTAEIKVAYRVYGRAMSVQGNWVDGSFALLNGAATFLTLARSDPRPHEVALVLPPTWRTSVTGLSGAPGRQPHHYVAADFDTLVDSPIYAGNPAIYEFQVDGVPHCLVNEGEGGLWDGPRSARDVEAIVRAAEVLLGLSAVREVRLLQPLDRKWRRPGTQELDSADEQSLGYANALRLPRGGSTW